MATSIGKLSMLSRPEFPKYGDGAGFNMTVYLLWGILWKILNASSEWKKDYLAVAGGANNTDNQLRVE